MNNTSPMIYDIARLRQAEIARNAERARQIAEAGGYPARPRVMAAVRRLVGNGVVRAGEWIQGERQPARVEESVSVAGVGLAR